jgi:hypothetical protein
MHGKEKGHRTSSKGDQSEPPSSCTRATVTLYQSSGFEIPSLVPTESNTSLCFSAVSYFTIDVLERFLFCCVHMRSLVNENSQRCSNSKSKYAQMALLSDNVWRPCSALCEPNTLKGEGEVNNFGQ